MPEPGREPGAITTLRLQGSEGKKKPLSQTPGASTQQLQSQIPMETAKIPTQPCPYGLLVLAGVGKKKEEKIKCIEKSHLQVYLPEETRHLWKSGVREGRARCKGPSDTQSTCEIPLPCPSTRFNPIFPGILALGEGASTVAPAAKPTLTTYTQNQAVFLFTSKAAHFPQALRHEPLGAPWDDTSPGGAQSNGQGFWGWISVPTTHSHITQAITHRKNPKIEGSVLQPGQSGAGGVGESPKALPKRTPMEQLPKINILFFFFSPPPSKLGHVKLGQHS